MDVLQLLVSGLANGCVYGLIALGFVLIYKATEQVNFAQGDMMMLGAYVTLGLTNSQFMGLPFWFSVPMAVVLMGVFGYLLDLFVLRFVAGAIWGHEPISLETPLAGRNVAFGGVVLGLDEIVIIGVTIVLTGALYVYFNSTRLGIAMQAASQNQLAAYYMGIPVKRINSLIWALSGAVAAIAGILFASKGSMDPSIGLLGIKAFAAAVIGGFGSLPGALLGGLIVGIIEPFASRYVPSSYALLIPYLLLFFVLVFRPHGILAQVHSKKV